MHKNQILRKLYLLFFISCCIACKTDGGKSSASEKKSENTEMTFDRAKWSIKNGSNYVYREKMLNDVLYNDNLRKLKRDDFVEQLGEPDRTNENYLYYEISRKRLVFWTLHARFMVVKFTDDESIEWIKVNE